MRLTFVVMSDLWNGIPIREQELEDVLVAFDADIAIALSDDAQVRQLNKDYRDKDKPTNVLSFPNSLGGGDVILAFETINREAEEQGKNPRDHAEHLVIHGCLHIMGYDHENDEEAAAMESIETELCRQLGFTPYEA